MLAEIRLGECLRLVENFNYRIDKVNEEDWAKVIALFDSNSSGYLGEFRADAHLVSSATMQVL